MPNQNPFRSEIEEILLRHQRTRFAKVLDGMKRELTDGEMSQEAHAAGQPCNAESIAYARKIVRLTMDDELVAAPSDAAEQAGLYRELLNYPCSPELRQHIMTRLTQLQKLDLSIPLTPLGNVRLGSNTAPKPEKLEPLCEKCCMVHNGECL